MPRARSICYTETRIDAAPAAVMAALRDVGAYAAWGCPFTERIDVDAASSSLAPGTLLTEHVRLSPGDAATRLTVVRVTECSETRLCWDSVILCACLLHATRTQTVELVAAAGDGGGGSGGGAGAHARPYTRYTSEDVMTGLLAPLVLWLYGGTVRRGFAAMAAALKAHVEARDAGADAV
jgi:hypothetical protein